MTQERSVSASVLVPAATGRQRRADRPERPASRVTAPVQPKSRRDRSFRFGRAALLAIAGLVGLGAAWRFWPSPQGRPETRLVWHRVERRDIEITVVERGSLESQINLPIVCEVDDVRRDGINGTPIVWIIPNGSKVKKGDLLVELDSAPIQERRDQQILAVEQAREAYMLAQSRYENQKTQNATRLAEAELAVELARLELEMFADEDSGTYTLEVEEIKRRIDDLHNEILAAQANLKLRENDKEGIEKLFRLGYAGKNELDRSRLDYLQAESAYAAKLNRLRTELASLERKETYERRMEEMRLKGRLETAKRNLIQVRRNNEAALVQVKASLDAKAQLLKKSEELLELYESQYEKCKIYAPQDGMVAYAEIRGDTMRPGIPVRTRQTIMTIPNMSKMQVRLTIHESVLERVRPGMKVRIQVDARPEESYEGTVATVAVLPEQTGWRNADTKVYETIVTIDEDVQDLKPGMTAVATVEVAHLEDVLAIPVEAVLEEGGQTWVYVRGPSGPQRRMVELGATDERYVVVRAGLQAGESVVLTPRQVARDQAPQQATRKGSGRSASEHGGAPHAA